MRPATRRAAVAVVLVSAGLTSLLAQRSGVFVAPRDHPSIGYSTVPTADPVARLNRAIENGTVRLTAGGEESGYLRSVLEALHVPVESQVAVFSKTSFEGSLINVSNPRTIFFGDSVAVGWVRGSSMIELAAEDPQQGVIFYTLDQQPADRPQFKRDDECLACHLSWETLGVPGLFVLSTLSEPQDKNSYATGFVSDHRSPLGQRWGGWYVTGGVGTVRHKGKAVASLASQFDAHGYLSPHSDIVALMVLEHQTRMVNLITRAGWEARLPRETDDRVRDAARDLVDYLLFIDEVSLPGRVRGTSDFAEKFSSEGPRDNKDRSLRQLDLERRLMRYPCSYMIYSEAFEALPPAALDAVYRRMWEILSGQERGSRYLRLPLADRRAIVEILRDTKKGLPDYFQTVTR
ncbi:MAG: hypothetical protein WBD07_14815 [Vicinamibacterales bacterium]